MLLHNRMSALRCARTLSTGSVDLGGSGVGSASSFSIPVSSMSVVSVPFDAFDEVAIGEGSAMSLGLEVYGD